MLLKACFKLSLTFTLFLFCLSFVYSVAQAATFKPVLSWQRSLEQENAVVRETVVGTKVSEALNLPLDPSQVVFDNGIFTAETNKRAIPNNISWASWKQYSYSGSGGYCGPPYDLRRFQAKFTLGVLEGVTKVAVRSPYYPGDTFPINDNAYVFLNGHRIGVLGTSYGARYLGFNGSAPYANETDGWIASGYFGPSVAQYLLTGENVLDIVAGEWCQWGGMGRLEVVIEADKQDFPKTPLIIVPGIGGSELKVNADTIWNKDDGHGGTFNRAYAKDETVWVNEGEVLNPGEDDYFDVLKMKNDGIDSEADLGLTGNLYTGAYQGTINFFTSNGYTLNQDLFVFPYDWRRDIALTAPLLDQKIDQIRQQTGSQRVNIVAHSMGGLVARNYIADPNRALKVRKLINLGTPHLGAVDFLKNLRYGGCLTKPELQNLPYCLGLTNSEVKDILRNMISGFQLAPSQGYFNFYSDEDNEHPYPYRTEDGALNYNQIKALLTNFNHNTQLFNPSEAFHSLDNNLSNTNGVEVTIVAGSGVQTLGQIIEEAITTLNGNKITYKDKININGDGTVPLLSASISDPHKGLFLNGAAQVFYTNQEHGGLVFNGPALDLIKNILDGSNQLPNGVSAQPFKLSGHGLSVHSPVNLHVYDANGNHTGPTAGGFETNIPGSSYDTLDDAKFIWLPDNGVYTLKFEATDQGTFDFKIRNFSDDINNNTVVYKDIPLTINTKAETVFDTASVQQPVLQVDNDGNGSTDTQVSSTSVLTGSANYDQSPPQTVIKLEGIKDNNGIYKTNVNVVLTASDEANGSGINKIEYSTDSGKTVQIYTEPILITQEGTVSLKVKAVDKAGNEEVPQEMIIKIDKTPPAKLQAIKYKWGLPFPGYAYAKWPIFESWQQVFIQNIGSASAYNVKATIASTPPNVQIVKGVVDLGNITASQSVWSQNNFQIKTDMAHPVDKCWGITWKIEYDDVFGAHYTLPNVPQFPPGQAPGGCP